MSERFNGALLTLARQTRKMSQPELVSRLARRVSQATLSKIETGRVQPDEYLVAALAEALRYRPSFFSDSMPRPAPPVSFHRKRQKLAARDREAIEARAEVYRRHIGKMLTSVELAPSLPAIPAIDPDEYDGRVDLVAAILRRRWALPRGPVADLTRTVEDAGVIVLAFDFGTPLIDGFSQHASDGLPPMVFLNSSQPKDRFRFSLAHEVAHLVLHRTPNREMEVQANLFASELLMPTDDIAHQLYNLSIKKFMDLKLHWKVSMHALIYKAWQIGKISDRGFKYYLVEMTRRGFRAREPISLPDDGEQPTTMRQLFAAHLDQLGYSVEDLSEIFGLYEDELRKVYPVPSPRPNLKLVV